MRRKTIVPPVGEQQVKSVLSAPVSTLRLWREPASGELCLAGRLDVSTVADVRIALHEALDSGSGDLVVNLAQVEVGDATGLGVLVGAHRRAGRRGRRLVLRGV